VGGSIVCEELINATECLNTILMVYGLKVRTYTKGV
jgi:hypothetical protein